MALAQELFKRAAPVIVILGAVAASLFYGDAIITPALSCALGDRRSSGCGAGPDAFSAAADHCDPRRSVLGSVTRDEFRAAAFFGPITCIWFLALAAAGAIAIAGNPVVLFALNPDHAWSFLLTHGFISFLTLGAVFLSVTGAEALYADLGHFGRKPIQTAWLCFVLPALVINYFGQGALVPDASGAQQSVLPSASGPGAAADGHTRNCSHGHRQPGSHHGSVFAQPSGSSVGYSLPRLEARHTSEADPGQIFMPRVNAFLLVGVLLLVGLFRSSAALASAYGIAVTGTMVVTAMLAFIIIWRVWHWHPVAASALVLPFLLIDCTFLSANLLKVFSGGWFPLLLGGSLLPIMLIWRRGSHILFEKSRRSDVPLADLIDRLELNPPPRIAGTAIYLTSDPVSTPTALLHSLKHFHVLHENNAILTLVMDDRPRVPLEERVHIEHLSASFLRITMRYGFTETPNLPRTLSRIKDEDFTYDVMKTTFFLSRRSLKASKKSGMPLGQDRIFIPLARNADDASSYFGIPTDRVIELGTQITI